MEIEYIDPVTGKSVKSLIGDLNADFFAQLSAFRLTEKNVKERIDNLNISADAKALLFSLNKITFSVGRAVIKIGKKIIDVIFSLIKNFPYLSFGVIFGLLLGALIAAIPLIGAALGSLATTIALALGVALGGLEEFKSDDLKKRIDNFVKDLSPLRNQT